MSSCSITFHNNPQAVFYGGQVLSGTAVLTTVKQKTIRAIYISIDGLAKVRWTETKSRRSGNKTVYYSETYSSHEQYLSSTTYVFGRESGNSIEFPAGTYTYNFQLELPYRLPSSFQGRHGQIRYYVVLTVDRPWRFNNTFMRPFTVISTLDLNFNPIYKLPLHQEQVKEFFCGCCNVQPIRVCCHTPFSGFAPGQNIPITVLVQNESSVNCHGSKVKLERIVRFTATGPYTKSRFDSVKVAEKQLGAVPRYTNKEFKEFIPIPAIPPSSLDTCRIIEISYTMTVIVMTSGCHRNAELVLPITIGTFPLRENPTNTVNAITVQPTATPEKGGDVPPSFAAYAPPSYEDAVATQDDEFVDADMDKNTKIEPYVPKYPVYHNYALPTAPPEDPPSGPSGPPSLDQAFPHTSSSVEKPKSNKRNSL